jgi:acetyl-CoA synthetase
VILAEGFSGSSGLEEELKKHVQSEIGPIARPEFLVFAESLPKTRSGKIMLRVLKAKALGQDEGDLTTLED